MARGNGQVSENEQLWNPSLPRRKIFGNKMVIEVSKLT